MKSGHITEVTGRSRSSSLMMTASSLLVLRCSQPVVGLATGGVVMAYGPRGAEAEYVDRVRCMMSQSVIHILCT
jgi:hypothetical protein